MKLAERVQRADRKEGMNARRASVRESGRAREPVINRQELGVAPRGIDDVLKHPVFFSDGPASSDDGDRVEKEREDLLSRLGALFGRGKETQGSHETSGAGEEPAYKSGLEDFGNVPGKPDRSVQVPTTRAGRAIEWLQRTGAHLDPEMRNLAEQRVKEALEADLLTQMKLNDAAAVAMLRDGMADTWLLIRNFGTEAGSFREYLERGLDILKEQNPDLPEDLDLGSPQGLGLALRELYVDLAALMLATQRLASEKADAMVVSQAIQIRGGHEELEARMNSAVEIVREELKANLDIAKVRGKMALAEVLNENVAMLQKARRAEMELKSLEALRYGLIPAAVVEGLGHIPLAPFKGFFRSLSLWIATEPLIAVGGSVGTLFSIAAIIGRAPAELIVVVPLGIIMLGAYAQGVWNYFSGRSSSQAGNNGGE